MIDIIKEIKTIFIRKIKKILLASMMHAFKPYKADPANNKIGVCSLICHEYVDIYIISIISFFYQTGINLPIFIVSDGSLTRNDIKKLKKYFTVTCAPTSNLKAQYNKSLYPHLWNYRFHSTSWVLKRKYDAYLFNPFSRFIVIDSDILFYKKPEFLIEFIKNNSMKRIYYSGRNDQTFTNFPYVMGYEYTFRKLLYKFLKHAIAISFNSGLLCVGDRHHFNLRKLDKIFKFFQEISYTSHGTAEETALSLLWSHREAEMLPPEKYIMVAFFEELEAIKKSQAIAIHYMGLHGLKDKFLTEAILLALKYRFFR